MFDFLKFPPKEKVPPHQEKKPKYNVRLTGNALDKIFTDCEDYCSREVLIGGGIKASYCYVDGLVNGAEAGMGILKAISDFSVLKGETEAGVMERLLRGGLFSTEVCMVPDMDTAVSDILCGCVLLVFSTEGRALALQYKSGNRRNVSEPKVENVVKGAKDAFNEDIRTNTALVRRKIRSAEVKTRAVMVGRKTATKTEIVWVEGVANSSLVSEMERRVKAIDIDGAIKTGDIEEYIVDNRRSMFPQVIFTERAARFANHLLEGRVGLLIDGLPMGYIAPGTLAQQMKSPEDRSNNYYVASAINIMRYFCLFLTVLIPAFYVAISTYNQEMFPTELLLTIIKSENELPFSTAVETLGMLIAFEILQEASLRLPQNIGQSVSIIGAIIVGETAVKAGLISPEIIIVVAVAGITGFVIPNQDLAAAIRMWRFLLTIAASFMGMLAVSYGLAFIIYRLCCAESFGVPYLVPFVSSGPREAVQFGFTRPAMWKTKHREQDLGTKDKRNQS